MTYAEAKDKAAKKKIKPHRAGRNYNNFEDLCEWVIEGWEKPKVLVDCMEEAAALAMANAKQEQDKVVNPQFFDLIKSTTRDSCLVAIAQNGRLVCIEKVPPGHTSEHGSPINIKIEGTHEQQSSTVVTPGEN